MSAEVRKVEALGKSVEYDPDMPMGTIKGLLAAGETGNLTQMIDALTGMVTKWDFDGDPSEVASWDALRRSQFTAITTAVMEDMSKLGEA